MEHKSTPDMPRLLTIDEIAEGDAFQEKFTITQEVLDKFIDVSQDMACVHVSPDHAAKMGFPGCLAHGFLGSLYYSRLLGMFLPGSNTVIHQLQIEMVAPVLVNDTLTYEVKVNRVIPGVKAVRLALTATNQHGVVVNRGSAMCVFRL